MKRYFAFALSALVVVAVASCSTLTQFPEIDAEKSRLALVVIDNIQYGGELPQFEECNDPDILCMDPPPFWFSATLQDSLVGDISEQEIQIATTSHYGALDILLWNGTALAMLKTDGLRFVMLRYAMREVVVGKNGKRFLFVYDNTAPWWLPCSANSLIVGISPDDLIRPELYTISKSDMYEYELESYQHLNDGYLPKSAIEYSALSALLEREGETGKIEPCEPS